MGYDVTDPQVKEALLKELAFLRSREDLWFFGKTYLSHLLTQETPEFHREIARMFQMEKRLGIAAPRNHGKTTLIQILGNLHTLLTGQDEAILSVSNTADLAKETVRRIKLELESNEKIRRDFGEILRWGSEISTKWTEEHITLHDPKTGRIVNQLRAKGWGGQIRGLRPTRVVCDDLEDRETVVSEDQRNKLKDWFLSVLLGSLKPDQRLAVVGTMLHPLSLLASIIGQKGEFRSWTVRKYRALEGGSPLWPERWSKEELERQKEQLGTYTFSQEFQNDPIPAETVLVKPDMVKRFAEMPEFVRIVGACDPAVSTKTSADYTAMVWIGVTKDNDFYEVRSRRGRWILEELVRYILDDAIQLNPEEFVLETIGFQQILKQVLIREARLRNVRLPIREVTLGKYSEKKTKEPQDKYSRLFKVLPYFEQGRVYLKNEDLIEELLLFPTGSHDDLVDALVYALMCADRTRKVVRVQEEGDHHKETFNKDIPFPIHVRGYNWRTAV